MTNGPPRPGEDSLTQPPASQRDVRTTEANDDTEEMINGVWDRLTGWCHLSRHIRAMSRHEQASAVDAQSKDPIVLDPLKPSTLP